MKRIARPVLATAIAMVVVVVAAALASLPAHGEPPSRMEIIEVPGGDRHDPNGNQPLQ